MILSNENLLEKLLGNHFLKMVPMSNYATIRAGGPAEALVEIADIKDLERVVISLWGNNIPFNLLGGCSNILVSDAGIQGVIILNQCSGLKVMDSGEYSEIQAESGIMLTQLSRKAAESGLSGMEWSSLIPGTVGGAVYGNAGAHGGEICKNLVLAEILHRTKGELSLMNKDLDFSYRNSNLKKEKGDYVILSATFHFTHCEPEKIHSVVAGLVERRRVTQPQGASFGSTFRNPIGEKAGKLIEASDLKGKRIGGAVISDKHANFIINDQNATALDIWSLIELAYDTVLSKFQISLCPEIELLGEWDQRILEKYSKMRTVS